MLSDLELLGNMESVSLGKICGNIVHKHQAKVCLIPVFDTHSSHTYKENIVV